MDQIDGASGQIEETDRIEADHMACTFPRIEHQESPIFLDSAPVVVAVKNDVMALEMSLDIERIVDDENPSAAPLERERGLLKEHSQIARGRTEGFALVVVPENTDHRHGQARKRPERLRLGDVAGVHHPIDSRIVEEVDDAGDVLEAVVRVADDSDSQVSAPFHKSGEAASAHLLKDMDSAGRAETNNVGHTEPGAFDLTLARFAAEMCRHLVDVGDARSTEGVPLGE